jgi:hypothetical protein
MFFSWDVSGLIPVADMQMALYVARRRPLVSFRGAESWSVGVRVGGAARSLLLGLCSCRFFLGLTGVEWRAKFCVALPPSTLCMFFVYSAPLALYHTDTPICVRGGGLASTL